MSIEVISVLLTLILGLPSLVVYLGTKRTRIVYIEYERINLFNAAENKFEKLAIKYDNQTIDDKLFLLRGIVICDGSNDITEKRSVIELILENEGKWLDFNITSCSRGLRVGHSTGDKILKVNLGLFKRKEFFKFECIFSAVNSKFSFHHRIPDIPKIKKLSKHRIDQKIISYLPAFVTFLVTVLSFVELTKITENQLIAFKADTNEKVDKAFLSMVKDFEPILDSLNKNTNGLIMLFRNSKNYDVTLAFTDSKTKEYKEVVTSLYFKKELKGRLFWVLMLSLMSVFYFYFFFVFLFRYRKFIRYLSA